MTTKQWLERLRPVAATVPPSGISAVFKHGFGRPGLIPLWVGEGELATPEFIRAAAQQALAAGETFYTLSAGLPALRAELAAYHTHVHGPLFGAPFKDDRFLITASGMQAIQLSVAAIAGHGDDVLVLTPAWPNFDGCVHMAGARTVQVAMNFHTTGWTLDFDRLEAAVTPATRALIVNSPSNPTGWTASRQDLIALLDFARRHRLWIIADQVYGRFYFEEPGLAPSFHEIISEDDQVIFVNTFSKNWAMTGWRLGWIEAPAEIVPTLEAMLQYSTSCAPVFTQKAAIAALQHGDAFIQTQIEMVRANRDQMIAAFAGSNRIRLAPPTGAFYLFFAIDGETDTQALAFRLVDEIGVGVAPGATFGQAGQGFMRICLARGSEKTTEATERLLDWLARNG